MTRVINVGGYQTGRAGVYQNSLSRASGVSSTFLPRGVVALVGEGTATTKPKEVVSYKKGSEAKLRQELEGDLLEACRILFKPSRDDSSLVRGASEIKFIRPNVATQGTLDLEDGSSNDLINLTSRIYGIKANSVSVSIAAGSDGAFGKKLTVKKFGATDEVGDNLGFNAALEVNYTGDGSACTCQITRAQLILDQTGSTDGSTDHTINFSTYDTLEKVAAYINAQNGYSATVHRNDGATFKCEDLDFIGATDCKLLSASGTVTVADTTSTTLTGTLPTGTADNDVIKVGSEYMFVVNATAKTVVRGYLDSTPAVHSGASGQIHFQATSVCADVIAWCNSRSQHLTASRDTAYNTGTPGSPSTETWLTGGSNGSASSSDYDDVFAELRKHDFNFIVLLDNTASYHAKLSAHLDLRWGKDGKEALGYVAAASGEAENALKVRSKNINDPNIAMCFQKVENYYNDAGQLVSLEPWALACAQAGMRAGMDYGEGCEYKILPFAKLSDGLSQTLMNLDPELSEWGLSHADLEDNFIRFVSCVSTWQGNDDLEKISHDVRNSVAFTLKYVRTQMKIKVLGSSQKRVKASNIQSILQDALDYCRDEVGSIVEGSQLNAAGERESVPAYRLLPVEVQGNVVGYQFAFTPTGSNKFIQGDSFVEDFVDVA